MQFHGQFQRDRKTENKFDWTETSPYAVLELLRELVNEAGVARADISIYLDNSGILSENVFAIAAGENELRWIGSVKYKGVAGHSGHNTIEYGTVFTTVDGLTGNNVRAINSDEKGKLYFVTKNGLSVFDGTHWITCRVDKGLEEIIFLK